VNVVKFQDYKWNFIKKNALIICSGSNIMNYLEDVLSFINNTTPISLAVNNSCIIPTIHLVTNNMIMKNYADRINNSCIPIFGQNVKLENYPDHLESCVRVNYNDKIGEPFGYQNGRFHGYYFSSACLAMMILHHLGFDDIKIAGMDGYNFYPDKDSVHWYKECDDEKKPKEEWKRRDDIIYKRLYALRDYGIKFSIITPTLFDDFYSDELLGGLV